MTKNEALERIEKRIENLIEKEINENQSDFGRGWDQGYNDACKQILNTIKLFKEIK